MRYLLMWVLPLALSAQSGDRILQSDSEVVSVGFTRDGKMLGTVCRDGKIRLWDLSTGKLNKTWEQQKGEVALFSGPRGQYGVIGSDGRIQLRDLASGAQQRQVTTQPRASRIKATEGGILAAAGKPYDGSSENLIRIWNAEGREQHKLPAGLGGVSAMAFSPDGQTLVAAAWDTDLRVWTVRDGELKRVIDEMTVAMFEVAFSPDGKLFASGGVDRTIYLWDTTTWKLARKITGQPEVISAIAFSPDGKTIATGGMNEMAFGAPVSVMLWDVQSGKPIKTLKADHRVGTVAFSPDGKRLAVADGDKTVSIWSLPN